MNSPAPTGIRPVWATPSVARERIKSTTIVWLMLVGGDKQYEAPILQVVASLAAEEGSETWDQMDLAAAEADDRIEADDWTGDNLLLVSLLLRGALFHTRCQNYYDTMRLLDKAYQLLAAKGKTDE
jgi:hypothetical protein